jgi:UTP--glucose-1-phosphate uridylyltransferase
MKKRPTKAIIAAAGFGTRFLPQTKAMPKEMLPIIDKPIIQIVVEELVEAGIRDIIIVGSSNKRAIEDHFDIANEDLLANLRAGGESKAPMIDMLGDVANLANFIYVRQKGPYGNATPILSAAHILDKDEPFIYSFADDFFVADPSRTKQLIDTYQNHEGSVYACKTIVDDEEYKRYGIIAGESIADGVMTVNKIIEKPGKDNAPSNLASVSSYLLEPSILDYIDDAFVEFDGEGEFTIQPIMQKMMDDGHSFYAKEITDGTYYDTGNKLEYLKTVIDFGLKHEDIGPELEAFIRTKLN